MKINKYLFAFICLSLAFCVFWIIKGNPFTYLEREAKKEKIEHFRAAYKAFYPLLEKKEELNINEGQKIALFHARNLLRSFPKKSEDDMVTDISDFLDSIIKYDSEKRIQFDSLENNFQNEQGISNTYVNY